MNPLPIRIPSAGAVLFGMGLTGMLDGIVFHQLLQWHSVYMWTDRPHQIMSDGWFHLFVTALISVGAYLLWQTDAAHPKAPENFWGGLLLGGGVFNLVEGIVDHHLLQIHHVMSFVQNPILYDLTYDLSAILMIVAGYSLLREKVPTR